MFQWIKSLKSFALIPSAELAYWSAFPISEKKQMLREPKIRVPVMALSSTQVDVDEKHQPSMAHGQTPYHDRTTIQVL